MVNYFDIRARQIEGTYPGDPMSGTWQISVQRVHYGWGETRWPGNSDEWPPEEWPGLDRNAKNKRSLGYISLRNLTDIRYCLATGLIPLVSLRIGEQWDGNTSGVIHDETEVELTGGHCVPVVGFDLLGGGFLIVNRGWGQNWGNHGTAVLSANSLDKNLISAFVTIRGNTDSLYRSCFEKKELIRTQEIPPFAGGVMTVCELYDGTCDERIAWAFLLNSHGMLNLEEFFVREIEGENSEENRRALLNLVKHVATETQLPLKYWISYADWEFQRDQAIETARELRLSLYPSPEKGAAVVAVHPSDAALLSLPSRSPDDIPEVNLPPHPAKAPAPLDLKGSITSYQDPFEPVGVDDWEAAS